MAHAGVGSVSFTFGLLLNSILGVKPTLVPFNGTGPAANALLGGQIDYMCNGIPELGAQVMAGTVKAFAIGTAERNPALPNVPTSREVGLPDFQALPWYALFAPKGTSRPILERLADALGNALNDQNVRKRFVDLGWDAPDKARRGQEALAALVKSEIARWTPIMKTANVKAE
jgi:tripartite-type tricarboxylate transporter receptor subunit TctC